MQMSLNFLRSLFGQLKKMMSKDQDKFLKNVTGVIHIGANTGQERLHYNTLGLDVIWVEPIPDVFEQLTKNISGLKKQVAYQYLLSDINGASYVLNIASNGGMSSSILNLKQHREIWPTVDYVSAITLTSITLNQLVTTEKIDLSRYQALVLDVQGAELLILKGGGGLLKKFRYIKLEVADFESYEKCCTVDEVSHFLKTQGFEECSRKRFAERKAGGSYFDVVYRNKEKPDQVPF
ncbi:FkbM family methyltransferase [Phragmitibacter flavus]|uniref:FkbM family methyltransferase n=1 Tax=Phragmitibacter flavus TaxID=2576071 RepID=A0A5R8KCF3_9BACT|nr:FkbM family methyltransferase [Phragmitibacter flavus]TLD69259.1 FkbM family methyltransferase [Phragmitibacter flavus]